MDMTMQVIGGVNIAISPFIIEFITLEVFITPLQYRPTKRKTQLPSYFILLDLMMNSDNVVTFMAKNVD